MYGGFSNECQHCGNWHSGVCPRIKAIEYHPNGQIARVEYHDPNGPPLPPSPPPPPPTDFDFGTGKIIEGWGVKPRSPAIEYDLN